MSFAGVFGWHRAVAFALTGERLDLPATMRPDPDALFAELAARGYDAHRLRAVAVGRRRAGEAWPFAVPADLADEFGPAQLRAAVVEAAQRVGARETRARAHRALSRDELRLLAERPPHHGSSG